MILFSVTSVSYSPYSQPSLLLSSKEVTETSLSASQDQEKPLAVTTTTNTTTSNNSEQTTVLVKQARLGKGYGSRGGVRVSVGPGTDDAVRVTRPFVLAAIDRDDDYYYDASAAVQATRDQAWLAKLVDWHQLTLDGAKQSAGGRRSRFKRPREAPEFPDFSDEKCHQPTKRSHLEADEQLLYKPWSSECRDSVESISVEQRKWCLLVDLSGGRAWSGLRERRREGELDSWSKMPAPTLPMQGDFRSEPLEKPAPLLEASSRAVASTWKAVLAAAEAFEKHLPCIRLDMMLDFFDHVRRLPPPSQVLDETTRIAQTVNECLGRLWKACTEARELRAKWMDMWYTNGVEIDAIRKALKDVGTLVPDECDELKRQLEVVSSWQERLDQILADASEDDPECKRNDLALLEALAHEARATHGFRCKGFVSLEVKLQKTYEMRERLQSVHDVSGTVKSISNLVRDIQRLRIRFPEANKFLLYSKDIDTWVERADIAIRSRISLQEVEDLIRRGKEYRLDLSEYLDKLQSRVQSAKTWLRSLQNLVDLDGEGLEWMARIRKKIEGGMNNQLHELACEGSRLPVEVDFVQMMHIELDARQWSAKAQKWLMSEGQIFDPSKQGKIEELKDHLVKAQALKARLHAGDRPRWKLNFETEVSQVVSDADKWFEERYGFYFEGDSRKTTSRRSISIRELRKLDEDGDRIPINLGTAKAKVNRFLVQAETWYALHRTLLFDAGLEPVEGSSDSSSEGVTLDQLKSAMDDANNGIAFDLEEVDKLSDLIEKLETWYEQVTIATGVGKRRFRGKKTAYTVEVLESLINESADLPVDTSESVEMLKDLVASVHEWRKQTSLKLNAAAKGIDELRQSILSVHGNADSFSRGMNLRNEENSKLAKEPAAKDHDVEMSDYEPDPTEKHLNSVESMIQGFAREASLSSVTTPEMEVVSDLENLSRWASRSIKYLSYHDEFFDKRFYGAVDRFMAEGHDLIQKFTTPCVELVESLHALNESCVALLNDQICRMSVLLKERNEFSSWCEQVEKILSNEDKRCTIEKLQEMHLQSQKFPDENELVKTVRRLNDSANEWIASAKRTIESAERLKVHDLKSQIDDGEKLGIQCGELRELRNGLKAARSWSNRLKKCKPEQCTAKMSEVNALVDEYEHLMVEMPDEIARLNKAIKHYCICRGNHHGHMIPCEDCKDVFHASCLGLTKARAEKVDKYLCLRCSVKKMYRTSSSTIATIVRKWTDIKELTKARQVEVQKHQRKSRKELKDLEKHRKVAEEMAQRIAQIDVRNCELIAGKDGAEIGPHQEPLPLSNQTTPVTEITEQVRDSPTGGNATSGTVTPNQEGTNPEGGSGVMTIAALDAERLELVAKMEKATKAIGTCQARLKSLESAAAERRNREELEDAQASKLRNWCVLVGNVIAPDTKEEADSTRPRYDGRVTAAMKMAISEAEASCLLSYRDVSLVDNAFKCMCWGARAMEILRRQPTSDSVVALVSQGQEIKFPDDKAFKTLRNMAERAQAWNHRFRSALTPVPGKSDPFDMNELHDLAKAADRIPFILPYEHRLETVIEDEGCRYCLCGGPSDGRFMVGCDKCDKWFHGTCVGVTGSEGGDIDHWFCPGCKGSSVDPKPLVQNFHDTSECEAEDGEDDDVASKAPDPATLWPPFGLRDSDKAQEALGVVVSSLQSSEGNLGPAVESESVPSQICGTVRVPPLRLEEQIATCNTITKHSSSLTLEVVSSSSCENTKAHDPDASSGATTLRGAHVLELREATPPFDPGNCGQIDSGMIKQKDDVMQQEEREEIVPAAASAPMRDSEMPQEADNDSALSPEGASEPSPTSDTSPQDEQEHCSSEPSIPREETPSCTRIVGEVAPVAS